MCNVIYTLFNACMLAAELGKRKEYLLCSCGQRTVLNSLKDHLGPAPKKICLSTVGVRTSPDVQHQLLCGLDAKLLFCGLVLPNHWWYLFQHRCINTWHRFRKITLRSVPFEKSTLGDPVWFFRLCEWGHWKKWLISIVPGKWWSEQIETWPPWVLVCREGHAVTHGCWPGSHLTRSRLKAKQSERGEGTGGVSLVEKAYLQYAGYPGKV